MTIGTVILLCVIHGLRGGIDDVRAIWGLDPGKPFSWLTHAFLHYDNYHLMAVTGLFFPSGALIEVYMGKPKLFAVILYTAIAAAVMSGIAVPEYWDTKSNPVGFSAVTNATFGIGVYLGARIITIQAMIALTAKPVLKKVQAWPWPTIGTVAGMIAVGVWLTLAIGKEWTEQDAAPRVAHSFGMITGGTTAILMALTTDRREEQQIEKSTTWIATVMGIIALLYIAATTIELLDR